jgi:hypothetical protein
MDANESQFQSLHEWRSDLPQHKVEKNLIEGDWQTSDGAIRVNAK